MNKVMHQLNQGRVKAIAYADDVVLLVSGTFLDSISNVMESALRRLNDWA